MSVRRSANYLISLALPEPDLLKPSLHLLCQAIRILDTQPSRCVLIGGAATDITAAHAQAQP